MLFDTIFTALRMIVCVTVVGVFALHLGARRAERGGLSHTVWIVVIAQCIAIALWLAGQLSILAFSLIFVLAVLHPRVSRGCEWLVAMGQYVWSVFADLFFVAGTQVDAGPAGKLPGNNDQSVTNRAEFVGFVRTAAAHGKARWSTARAAMIGSSSRDGGADHGVTWRSLVPIWLAAAVVAVAVVAVRASSAYPVTSEDARRLLQHEGVAPAVGSWLGEIVFVAWAQEMTGALPIVGAVAICAPIVFIAAWSGSVAIRHFSASVPVAAGALALAAVPAIWLLRGNEASLDVLVGPLLPLAIVILRDLVAITWAPTLLAIALSMLHPLAGPLAFCTSVVYIVIRLRSSSPRNVDRLVYGPILLVLCTAVVHSLYGANTGVCPFSQPFDDLATTSIATEVATLALAVCGWLICVHPSHITSHRKAARHTLAVVTLAATALAGGVSRDLLVVPAHWPMTLLCLGAALCIGDIAARYLGRRSAALLASAVAVALALTTPNSEREGGVRADVCALVADLDRLHLSWGYTVVAHEALRPSVAGAAHFIGGARLRDTAPVSAYSDRAGWTGDLAKAEYIYVVLGATEHANVDDMDIRVWLRQVQDAAIPVEKVLVSSRWSLEVYRMRRSVITDKDNESRERILSSLRHDDDEYLVDKG